jgi:hypothetical protein
VIYGYRCGECDNQPEGFTSQKAALSAWRSHHDREHSLDASVHQLPTVDWHSRALRAVLELAAKGDPFVISEVIHLGVPDAPNPRTDWPRIQREAADLGWIVKTGRLGHSVRPSTKGSPVTEWIGTAKARRAA